MAEIGRTISNSVHNVFVDADPTVNGVDAPIGSYATLTSNNSLFLKTTPLSTGWEATGDIGGGVPIGAVEAFAVNEVPTGWLKCNGASYLRSEYSFLFSKIGTTYGQGNDPGNTFQVPDLREEFVRGWVDDKTGGPDDGRALGTNQNDDANSVDTIVGDTQSSVSTGTRTVPDDGNLSDPVAYGATDGGEPNFRIRLSKKGTETRPRNIAMLYCIKATRPGEVTETAEFGSEVVSLGTSTEIDWIQGDIFEADLTSNTTYTFTNEPTAKTIIVTINNTSASPINVNLPSGLLWADGTAITEIPANTSGVFTLIKKNTQIFANAIVGMS